MCRAKAHGRVGGSTPIVVPPKFFTGHALLPTQNAGEATVQGLIVWTLEWSQNGSSVPRLQQDWNLSRGARHEPLSDFSPTARFARRQFTK